MAERAKILHDGDEQTVQLPRSCRFPDDQTEVLVRREGRGLFLEPEQKPKRTWSKEFLELLGTGTEDIERPSQPLITEIPNPFDDSEE